MAALLPAMSDTSLAVSHSPRHSVIGSILMPPTGSLKLFRRDGHERGVPAAVTKSVMSSGNRCSGRGDEYPRDDLYDIPLTPTAKLTPDDSMGMSNGECISFSSGLVIRKSCAELVGDDNRDIFKLPLFTVVVDVM